MKTTKCVFVYNASDLLFMCVCVCVHKKARRGVWCPGFTGNNKPLDTGASLGSKLGSQNGKHSWVAEQPLQSLKVTCSLLLDQNFSIYYVRERRERGKHKKAGERKEGEDKKNTPFCRGTPLQITVLLPQVSLLVSPSFLKQQVYNNQSCTVNGVLVCVQQTMVLWVTCFPEGSLQF